MLGAGPAAANGTFGRSRQAYPSFRELRGGDERANRLANLLRDLGVQKGDRVALYLDKSIEAVLAIYGILKAGAAYVPLDAQAPTSRLGYIARDAGVWVAALLSGPAYSRATFASP